LSEQKLTPNEIKLLKDPDFRLDNLYKIKDKNKRIVKFKKTPIQQLLHKNSTGFDNILKARQLGISTYFLLKKLDAAIFTPNYTACILSHKRESMEKLFSIIRRAVKYMHPLVQPVIDKGGGSKYEIRFPEIDSKIYCTMEAVSDTVNDLHISEMALMKDRERVDTSMDAVPLVGGIISIETTPRGFNHYHKFWNDPDTMFKNHFFPWYLQDEYQIEFKGKMEYTEDEIKLIGKALKYHDVSLTKEQIMFRRMKIKQKKGKEIFMQEFPEDDKSCFIASGDNPFDLEILTKLINNVQTPLFKDETLEIFELFDSNKRYVCGADTAEGKGGDYSVATMFEVGSMKQVAQLRSNKWKPRVFADKLYDFCTKYHKPSREWPLLAVELNNHGHAVILQLEDHLQYSNLYSYKEGQNGWLTNMVTRPLMIDGFIDGVEDEIVKLNSNLTLNECLTLINNKGKIEAEDGEHDDCIIAASIAIQMCIKEKSNISIYDDISNKILI